MTCKHINEAKNKISILTTLVRSKGIHKEEGPYLTPSEVKKYTHGAVYNSSKEEIEQLSKYYRFVDETSLKKELDAIYKSLAECQCYSKEKELLEEAKKDKEISERDKKTAEKSLEEVKKRATEVQKKAKKEKLKSKKKELTDLVSKSSEEGNNCGKEVFELQRLYQILFDYRRNNNGSEERKTNERINEISGELIEKGMRLDKVEEISQICEKMAKLKLETEYQARIEISTNN